MHCIGTCPLISVFSENSRNGMETGSDAPGQDQNWERLYPIRVYEIPYLARKHRIWHAFVKSEIGSTSNILMANKQKAHPATIRSPHPLSFRPCPVAQSHCTGVLIQRKGRKGTPLSRLATVPDQSLCIKAHPQSILRHHPWPWGPTHKPRTLANQ
jgi:hypothetical protein